MTPVGEFAATTCLQCPACPENNQALNVSSSAHFDATCTRQISCYTCCSIVDFFPAFDDLPGSKQHSCAPVRIISFCLMSSFGFQLSGVIYGCCHGLQRNMQRVHNGIYFPCRLKCTLSQYKHKISSHGI